MSVQIITEYNFAKGLEEIPDYIPLEAVAEIFSNTPRIPFLSLNDLLQRQFYKLCHPVTYRQLFLSSKKIAEIPQATYISTRTKIQKQNNSSSNFPGMI